MIDLSEFRDIFLEELNEQLQMIEEELLTLEREGGTEAGIGRLFRAAHTLKGSSAAMGYVRLKELTHEMEHVLERLRSRELLVTEALIGVFFKGLDGLRQLQSEIVQNDAEHSNMDELIRGLRSSAEAPVPRVQKTLPLLPSDVYQTFERLTDAERPLRWLTVRLSARCEMRYVRFQIIERELEELPGLVWRELDDTATPEETADTARWLVSSSLSDTELVDIAAALMDVEEARLEEIAIEQLRSRPEPVLVEEEAEALPAFAPSEPRPDRTKQTSIRVNVERLERMMNLVGELVIDQTRIQQAGKLLRQRFGPDEAFEDFSQLSDHLTRTVGELQESVMKVRMLPLEQLFNRFPRLVRDLSLSLDKEVELVLEGKDTELDRNLIEEIGDPLIHLVRNAIDHGLERPEERLAAGKPARGTLRIAAAHEDDQVSLVIEDDGAGIQTDKLRQKAVDRGLLSEAEAAQLSERDAVQLIFHPGLSTASRVSDVSGRGVGMDIVRNDIERMNGLIDIDTEPGRGTRFKIRLPLTLAITTGLVIIIGGRTFIVPMSNVAEIVRIEQAAVKTVRGVPVLTLRDQVIPVVHIHRYFGYEETGTDRRFRPIVIIGRAEKRIALGVDELVGNQEIVVRSLGSYIGKVEGISGATILGDGKVALILETGGIMKMINR
ncbi:chemotaxis protein CheA [Paenibacillus sp. 598K]|uniref:chemotaxis protein CheA n=1 Tax=Paenibacillus sp. 598K TaxID=1117987 RepID=UPI000FF98CDA|nr:chemotaxis protein CheA [Paenibacillus sp. 598K]GBF77300.1 chemotaxis protein CheA [Paenibacillus sp. 598K]